MTAVGALQSLLTPEAVRERCGELFKLAANGDANHFEFRETGLDDAVKRVVHEIERNYPDGRVPFHSRWRHFELGGRDLWAEIRDAAPAMSGAEEARARIDLAVVSVLLDAGAGAEWIYRDEKTGLTLGRSEGLALASLRMFEAGLLSDAGAEAPLRCDAAAMQALTPEVFLAAFQVGSNNPLLGADLRVRLINNLGEAILRAKHVYGANGTVRPGHLFDHLKNTAGPTIAARSILTTILETLGGVWPAARRFGDVTISDCGTHTLLERDDATKGLVPFHKLSQWMSYSLIEPIEDGGVKVLRPDDLTGLAEYRNGGLLIDSGAIVLKNAEQARKPHEPTSELIVEWRALTVALLDRIADEVRTALGADAGSLPLASVLQGGTWSAGRRIAQEIRADGGPPLKLLTDGSLF